MMSCEGVVVGGVDLLVFRAGARMTGTGVVGSDRSSIGDTGLRLRAIFE
jgi:hypothetical protein